MPDESPSATLSDGSAPSSIETVEPAAGGVVAERAAPGSPVAESAAPMTDTVTSVAEAPVPRCPWCSAELPVGEQIQCPSCGANLVADGDPSIPGVTEVIGQAARPSP